MAILYISIIGFVVVAVGLIVYFGTFLREKTNLTFFHVAFMTIYVAIGVAMIINRAPYTEMM